MPVRSAPTCGPIRNMPARKPSGSSGSYVSSGSEMFTCAIPESSRIRTVLRMAQAAIEVEGLRKSFRDVQALCGIDLARRAAPCSACSARTAPARPPLSASSPRCSRPTAAPRGWPGSTWSRTPPQLRAQIGLAGQYAAVDENLTGFENLDMVGRLYHLGRKRRRASAHASCSSASTSTDAARPPRQDLLGRHAPPARPRRRARRPTRPCCSSTSPPPASTRAAGSACGRRSRRAWPAAPPCCSRPSTSTRPTGWRTASR